MKNSIPNLTIIVAADLRNGIGIRNTLPWHLSDDLKRFKAITSENVVIMGRNTWFSLPKRPLPNRQNVVLTLEPLNESGAIEMNSIDQLLSYLSPDKENFIIGGDSIYRQFFPLATKILLTRVLGVFETDTCIPDIFSDEWILVNRSEDLVDSKSQIPYCYETYHRK